MTPSHSSLAKNLAETFNDPLEFRWMARGHPAGQPPGRKRPDLGNLRPCPLWQPCLLQFQRERKARPWLMARQRDGNHRAGAIIENGLAEDKDRAATGLFMAHRRIPLGPINIASQYAGHSVNSLESPMSRLMAEGSMSSLSWIRLEQENFFP